MIKKVYTKYFATNTNDIHSRKNELVFYFIVNYIIVLLIPTPFYLFSNKINNYQLISSLFGLAGGLVSLLTFSRAKSYKTPGYIFISIGIISNLFAQITYGNGQIDSTLFSWYFIYSIFSFIVFDKKTSIIAFCTSIIFSFLIATLSDTNLLKPYQSEIIETPIENMISLIIISIFLFQLLKGYQNLYFHSNEIIQHLLGEKKSNQKKFIDLNNQNYAMTEELLESQKELEENIISINNLNYKLHSTENHLVAIQEANPVGILIFDINGDSIYINSKGKELLGLKEDDSYWLLNKDLEEFKPSEIDWQAMASKSESINLELKFVINNKTKWIQTLIAPIKDNDKVSSFIGTITDLTDQQQEKELLYLLYETINHSNQAFYVANTSGRYIFFNEIAKSLLSIQNNTHDVSIFKFKKPKNVFKNYAEYVEFLKQNTDYSFEETVIHHGKTAHFYISEKLFEYNHKEYIIGSLVDITDKIQIDSLETELLKLQLDNRKNQIELEEKRLDFLQQSIKMKEERIRIAAILTGQENERKRLSRELHDGIGQMLTALKIKFEMLDISSIENDLVKEKLADIKANIKKTIFETRKISQDLMPSALEDFGFSSAIRILTEEFSALKGVKVVFKDRKLKNELPHEIRINLFRIVQEALSNVSKHSDATKIIVEIIENEENVYLKISDNGTNFDLRVIGEGLGLNNMKERTNLLNGLFNIYSNETGGCELEITIPINHLEEIKI
jgi:PAS domain S-box-containing protein